MKEVAITLPKLGESVADATLTTWLVQVGEEVTKDQILCEVGTDKVETELPSEFNGIVVNLLCNEGDVINVGEPLLVIKTNDEIAAQLPVDQVLAAQEIKEQSQTKSSSPKIEPTGLSVKGDVVPRELSDEVGFLSPVVRKMVVANAIAPADLVKIKGSGANGRIAKKDIEAFLSAERQKMKKPSKRNLQLVEGDEVKPLSRTRQIIAEKMQEASQWIPHVTTFVDIDVSALMQERENQKQQFIEQHQTKLTYTHYMMYFVVEALKQFPALNSWMNDDEWIIKKDINLAFAIAVSEEKLIVPNIKAAQNFSFIDLVKAVNSISEKAKLNQLKADDLQHSTFTVSNTGIFGSMMGTPIISAPQVAIIAFGEILRKPVVQIQNGQEQIVASNVMTASISYDHRVIDGKLASQFLKYLKDSIESFGLTN